MKDTKMIAGETDISSGEASFYIHIPFCVSKCAYCDFFSIPVDSEREKARMFDDYLEALCYDIERQIGYFNIKTRSSLYVGGGTPSLLGGRRIEKLLSFLKRALPEGGKENVRPEITVEANSESLSEEFIAACVGSGVSRLSVGVQSLNDRSRDAIGRKGSSVFIKRNLDLLKNIQHYAGQAFDISFDLISGLPYQNKTMLLNDIETMLLYNPAHISLYDLMIEEGTPLSRSLAPGGRGTALPQEEEAEDIWIAGRDYLESAGFSQYEISNFARAGKRARHNIRYWNMQSWLGFGPSASGTLIDNATGTGIRYTVLPDIAAYIVHNKKRGGFIPSYERLDRKTLLRESLMMGFRYIDGPCESLFKQRFSLGIDEAIAKTITIWRARGLYAKNKNALTKDGLLFLNRFLLDCFNELEG